MCIEAKRRLNELQCKFDVPPVILVRSCCTLSCDFDNIAREQWLSPKNAATMSKRAFSNIETLMPKISDRVAERKRDNNPNTDLSIAENWLLRPELTEICKQAIQDGLTARVRFHRTSCDRN